MIRTSLGHYRIVEKIGAGGMGDVYRATDAKLGRDVAIKILSGVFADAPERLARFEREARLLAALNHPNIATLHGFEKDGDTHFLVMELVSGSTLAERIASGGKVSLRGGSAIPLCETSSPSGGSWGPDDWIVFAPMDYSGLSRVSAAGGACLELTKLGEGESGHRWPEFLPGGKDVMFTVGTGTEPQIVVQSLETSERRRLLSDANFAHYVPSGHLVYSRQGDVLAAPFDISRLETTGPSLPIADDLGLEVGYPHFSVSGLGWLVYRSGGASGEERILVWVDRKGRAQPIPAAPADYLGHRLSPDGNLLVANIRSDNGVDVWTYDLSRDVPTRLTFGTSSNAAWSPDGKEVFFSRSSGKPALFRMSSDGSGSREELLRGDNYAMGADSLSHRWTGPRLLRGASRDGRRYLGSSARRGSEAATIPSNDG